MSDWIQAAAMIALLAAWCFHRKTLAHKLEMFLLDLGIY